MIRLGLKHEEKKSTIAKYLKEHPKIKNVIIFTGKGKEFEEEEEYTWEEIIMYKVFYPLLERIDDSYLLVVNEILRTSKRSDLTYNCLHHYLNQTSHKIIFAYFPIINDKNDFMILADCVYIGRFRGYGYNATTIRDIDIKGHRRTPKLKIHEIEVEAKVIDLYEQEKEKLFANLGNKDPDTIPRYLHLWSGKWKKKYIEASKNYVARNDRFKLSNVKSYKSAIKGNNISLDIPHKRIELNDYLYRTQSSKIEYLSTSLKVDKYYGHELELWNKKVSDIYAEASICQ